MAFFAWSGRLRSDFRRTQAGVLSARSWREAAASLGLSLLTAPETPVDVLLRKGARVFKAWSDHPAECIADWQLKNADEPPPEGEP